METGSSQRTQHSETDRDAFTAHEMQRQARSWQSNHCKERHQSRMQVGIVRARHQKTVTPVRLRPGWN